MIQQAFTEFPKPKKFYYTVLVQIDDSDCCECAISDCKTKDDASEYYNADIDVFQCDCCGQWFCITHIDARTNFCVNCKMLSSSMRQMIETFREELNQVR